MKKIEKMVKAITSELEKLSDDQRIDAINEIRTSIHGVSPMKDEPVDCVIWVKNDLVFANDYNPNTVAPPEMKLLEVSILEDGYTQPIVAWRNGDKIEVVDGFHRNRVGKESNVIRNRVHGRLPVAIINDGKSGKTERIASTIRHNRARGKHMVDAMSEIVVELKNRNWKNDRISRELGMDEDEILRLMQITGLESLFKDEDFSRSWMIEDSELEFDELSDDVSLEEKEENKWRTVNTSDKDRIFHTYDKWECFAAGFYNTTKDGMTESECEEEYRNLLTDQKAFELALDGVITNWKHSCEHYLTNRSMNRIAWLGQAALCYARGIPSAFRGGFNLLTEEQQRTANLLALSALNKWLSSHKMPNVSLEEGLLVDKQSEIY